MTPQQEDEVRRVLAALARRDADPTLPPHVADRLDGVLADLVADRHAPVHDDPPAPQRGLRRWSHQLVAAAAVAVIGLAGAAVATHGFRGSNDTTSSASTPAPGSASGSASGSAAGSAPGTTGLRALAGALPRLRSADLQADVARLVTSRAAAAGEPTVSASAGSSRSSTPPKPGAGTSVAPRGSGKDERSTACPRPPAAPGERVVAVLLDGRPATLLLAAPVDGSREARVYSCAQPAHVLARTTVPAG